MFSWLKSFLSSSSSSSSPQSPNCANDLHNCVPLCLPEACGLQKTEMDDALRAYLAACFTHSEPEMEESELFLRCVDHHNVPNHIYFEGYFHTLPTHESLETLHPRLGINFQKPAAPLPVRQFCAALRAKNVWLCELLENQFDAKFELTAFSDAAVQIHYGDEISGDEIGWHYDAMNSLLHCALSLRGTRQLHVSKSYGAGCFKSDLIVENNASDVYFSQPFGFGHAVSYPQSEWKDRVIAVQLRFLLTENSWMEMRALSAQGKAMLQRTLCNAMQENDFVLPTLAEVQAVQLQDSQVPNRGRKAKKKKK